MSTCHWPLQGVNHELLQPLTSNTPWKEFRVESRNEALRALGKTGRTGLQIVRYFQEPILWAQFLYLLISRKALKSFMVTDVCSCWLAVTCTRLAATFCKKCVLGCMYSPFTKITYILIFLPASLEQFLRAIWDAVSWAAVLILPQIKLNSLLSCCAFFLSRQGEIQLLMRWIESN